MKKIHIFLSIALILCAAFITKEVFASGAVTMAILPIVARGSADPADLQRAIQDAMEKENPTVLGHYTGQNNHSLSFSGGSASSFLDENTNTSEFGIRLINATASMQRVILCPAYFSTFALVTSAKNCPTIVTEDVVVTVGGQPRTITVLATYTPNAVLVVLGFIYHDVTKINASLACDAVIDDDVVLTSNAKNVTVSSLSKGTVRDFLNYCKKNPTRVTQMVIASNNVSQYNRKITLKRINPAGDWGEEYIQLTKYFETSQYRTEKIIVDTDAYNLQFDDQTLISFELEAAVSVDVPTQTDITMSIGASINDANELIGMATTAKKVIKLAAAGLKNMY